MTINLPAPIAKFIEIHNAGDTEAVLDVFVPEAVVEDEKHRFQGEEIKDWLADVTMKYHPLRIEVTGLSLENDQHLAAIHVTGTFPGSPIDIRYKFTLEGDRIAHLWIGN